TASFGTRCWCQHRTAPRGMPHRNRKAWLCPQDHQCFVKSEQCFTAGWASSGCCFSGRSKFQPRIVWKKPCRPVSQNASCLSKATSLTAIPDSSRKAATAANVCVYTVESSQKCSQGFDERFPNSFG